MSKIKKRLIDVLDALRGISAYDIHGSRLGVISDVVKMSAPDKYYHAHNIPFLLCKKEVLFDDLYFLTEDIEERIRQIENQIEEEKELHERLIKREHAPIKELNKFFEQTIDTLLRIQCILFEILQTKIVFIAS